MNFKIFNDLFKRTIVPHGESGGKNIKLQIIWIISLLYLCCLKIWSYTLVHLNSLQPSLHWHLQTFTCWQRCCWPFTAGKEEARGHWSVSLPVDRRSLLLVALQSNKISISSFNLEGICIMASNASMSNPTARAIFLRCAMNYLSGIWILFTSGPWIVPFYP